MADKGIRSISDGEIVRLMAAAGYDIHAAHPDCYRNFSYRTFAKSLLRAAQTEPEGATDR